MRTVLAVAAAAVIASTPVWADSFSPHSSARAFWLNAPWPADADRNARPAAPKFTKTYTDGLARRFGVGGGHLDFFERKLGPDGEAGPALVGTVDHGAPSIVLRWHPGD